MSDDSSDSDYIVEDYVKPDKIGAPLINDESADLLGNFDDTKRKSIEKLKGYQEENSFNESPEDDEETPSAADTDSENDNDQSSTFAEHKSKPIITEDINVNQINELRRGVAKSNRLVLYVTNLNFATDKQKLMEFFSVCGQVKSVRIPKKRKGGFAFIEMADIDGFQNGLKMHNKMLDERTIKIQLSEAGKKKSANKKNILKQKNRRLAVMRNETKSFTKSGKNYCKDIKKEIQKERDTQDRIRAKIKAKRAAKYAAL